MSVQVSARHVFCLTSKESSTIILPPSPPLNHIYNLTLSHHLTLSIRDVRLLILESSRWSMVEKYQVLCGSLTVEKLMEFSKTFKAHLYAEGLVQGNVTSAVGITTLTQTHSNEHCTQTQKTV